jgi:hypothetical protein
VFGALLTSLTLLADPGAAAIPLVAAGWACALLIAAEPQVQRPPGWVIGFIRSVFPLRPRLHPVQQA